MSVLILVPVNDLPHLPLGFERREIHIMNQNQSNSFLSINVKIRFRTRLLYWLQVKDAVKWLVLLIMLIAKVITEYRAAP